MEEHREKALVGLAQDVDRQSTVAAALQAIADQVDLASARNVLIKANFVSSDRQLSCTHVDAVRAVLDFVRERHSGKVIVAEGTALSSTWDGFRNYCYESLVDEYGVELCDLNQDETVEVTVRDWRLRPLQLRLARTVADADFRISICPPKTHDTVIVTATIKNIVMGALVNPHADKGNSIGSSRGTLRRLGDLIPGQSIRLGLGEWFKRTFVGGPNGSQKMSMHQGIPVINLNLALVAPTVWPHLSVVDGWQGMEGNGPGLGDAVDWRVALAGIDPLAVDTLTAELMGFDPEEIGYLHYCRRLGLGVGSTDEIRVVGNVAPDQIRRVFAPSPTHRAQLAWRRDGIERYLSREESLA